MQLNMRLDVGIQASFNLYINERVINSFHSNKEGIMDISIMITQCPFRDTVRIECDYFSEDITGLVVEALRANSTTSSAVSDFTEPTTKVAPRTMTGAADLATEQLSSLLKGGTTNLFG